MQTISCGVPQSILQNEVWALPPCRHHVTVQAACQFSLDNSTYVAVATTTGFESSWAFIKCTSAATIVSCKKM